MNVENYKLVLNHIKKNKKMWDQTEWHCASKDSPCGTVHCFAGHAELLAGHKLPKRFLTLLVKEESSVYRLTEEEWDFLNEIRGRTLDRAMEFLDLTREEADYLFNGERTLQDFTRVLKHICTRIDLEEIE